MSGMEYFAYGSNMNPERLRTLGVAFAARRPACLPGWRIVFRKCASDAGPVPRYAYATIEPAAGAVVEGVLYALSGASALARLDEFEGVPDLYRRQTVPVQTDGGAPCPAAIYVARPEVCADGLLLEDWYRAHLLAAADLLSPDYVRFLSGLPVVQTAPRW
ncbi:MAG: gamma-glutamylcyclotransferase family protein [Pseudomonadota bacterium]